MGPTAGRVGMGMKIAGTRPTTHRAGMRMKIPGMRPAPERVGAAVGTHPLRGKAAWPIKPASLRRAVESWCAGAKQRPHAWSLAGMASVKPDHMLVP